VSLRPGRLAVLRWRPRPASRSAVLALALAAAALCSGIAAGAVAVGWLGPEERRALDSYLGDFFHGLVAGRLDASGRVVLATALRSDVRVAAVVWAAGLFAYGAPLALLALFARGFAVGFTVAFLFAQEGPGGLALAVVTVLPGSLISLPALVALAGASLGSSGRLLLVRLGRRPRPAPKEVAAYAAAGAAALAALFAAGAVEGYLVPPLVRLVGPHLGL
jgi:stage II sporulation protein M